MKTKIFPKWLSWSLTILSILNLSAYVTTEIIYDKDVELYRYILTFIFGLMFYGMAMKKDN